MTYCVGLLLNEGMVLLSDTRTNAGLDNIATYRKMMGQLITIFAETELAFLEGDLDKVAEKVDAMRASKKDAHEIFIEE